MMLSISNCRQFGLILTVFSIAGCNNDTLATTAPHQTARSTNAIAGPLQQTSSGFQWYKKNFTIAHGGYYYKTLRCPGSNLVVSGGYFPGPYVVERAEYPDATSNGWEVYISADNSTPTMLTVYALCKQS